MNPFEENNIINTNIQIEIWLEINGRKKNTFISGWNIPINELKDHIKNIKKKNGCNGTIKSNNLIQLQGDHIDYIIDYINNTGISDEFIKIKG